VPLSSEARRILQLLPSANLPDDQDDDENSVFDLTTKDVDALFRKIRTKAGVPDVHFHDARATALTRLSKIFTNPLELAKISGHRDLKMLLNVYYRPDVSTFADRMG
jgi:integrase